VSLNAKTDLNRNERKAMGMKKTQLSAMLLPGPRSLTLGARGHPGARSDGIQGSTELPDRIELPIFRRHPHP